MMKEILISSAALILALLLLRRLFRGVLSRRVQYALWGLVLARLLIPFSLPAADFSVLTTTQPIQQAVAERFTPADVFAPVEQAPLNQRPAAPDTAPERPVASTEQQDWATSTENTAVQARKLSPAEIAALIWTVGMALVGGFFLLSNLLFYRRLLSSREKTTFTVDGLRCPVYRVPEGALPSPCLFGWSIYLTPAVCEDENKRRHVLAHEGAHARQLDPLWSLLRCLCLTIYWFDPLVWIAARCSKTDCELACDERALKALGEEERIPYGKTLLSLIPVKRVENPLLAATSMTAGKKQLTDRVRRIADRPRQFAAAALAVAVLAGIVSACTFTGASSSPVPDSGDAQVLSGSDLRFFNEEYFNWDDMTIRNQFANPINLYDTPEDIDLYELFYCEGGAVPDDELYILDWDDPTDLPCPAYKLTTAEMDEILTAHLGKTLSETNKVGLENFTYNEETDAYYFMHGDTNYCGDLNFTSGVREGDTVNLYHNSAFTGEGWYCITLRVTEDGYLFVSNQKCEMPVLPTALPEGEPLVSIDFSTTSYVAPTVTVENRNDLVRPQENWELGGHKVITYRSAEDGKVRAALKMEDGTVNAFFTLEEGDFQEMFFFNDLFGHDGFYLSYFGEIRPNRSGTVTDYYYVTSDEVPVLLCRVCSDFGTALLLDLDGDGQTELCSEQELFFQRENTLYHADLPMLLEEHLPFENFSWGSAVWDEYGRYLSVRGYCFDDDNGRDVDLLVYFQSGKLLVYRQVKSYTDHVVDGATSARNVPDQVVADAKSYILSEVLIEQPDGTWRYREEENSAEPVIIDDWRIESFPDTYTDQFTAPASSRFLDTTIEGWAFNYELHTTTPERVTVAGGRYLTVDNWVSPGYPRSDWLFYRVSGETRELLWHAAINDASPDSYLFREWVLERLTEREIANAAGYQVQNALTQMNRETDSFVLLATPDGIGGGSYPMANSLNGNNRLLYLCDPSMFSWSQAEEPEETPAGATLMFSDSDWYRTVQFWEGSELVMVKTQYIPAQWYRAEYVEMNPAFESDIFSYMRLWYDEAESLTLRSAVTVVDSGQSPYEAALEYLTRYEEVSTSLSPGSRYAYTYAQVSDLQILEDMPEGWFPTDILGYPHFAFDYDLIFVPESELARNYSMAGNTGIYEGSDPNVPKNALICSRRGSLYLKDGQWLCGGIGTG